jgi:hypothetical protein
VGLKKPIDIYEICIKVYTKNIVKKNILSLSSFLLVAKVFTSKYNALLKGTGHQPTAGTLLF